VLLLKILKDKRDCGYLLTGTLRRTLSKKFSRKITWLCAFCASAVSTDIKPRDRLIEKHAIAGRYEGVFLPRAQFQKYSPFLNIG
jgi:hypothetical protein